MITQSPRLVGTEDIVVGNSKREGVAGMLRSRHIAIWLITQAIACWVIGASTGGRARSRSTT
jgi:hypothetical protein